MPKVASVVLAVLLLLASGYFFLGALQGVMLFTGERAFRNFNHWSALSLLAGLGAIAVLVPWRRVGGIRRGLAAALAGIALALSIALIWPIAVEPFAVGACLDSGGSYDYVMSVCDHVDSHEFMPLWQRSGLRLTAATLLLALAAALVSVFVRKARGGAG